MKSDRMDPFQREYPHLNWPWWRRKRFIWGYAIGMKLSYLRTKWFVWTGL